MGGADDDVHSAIEAAQHEALRLQGVIRGQKEALADTTLSAAAGDRAETRERLPRSEVRMRRTLRGHAGKVSAVAWAPDSSYVVSAGQDGRLLLWDPLAAAKHVAVTLRSSYVMCCDASPCGRVVACGGLDNTVSVFDVGDELERARAGASLPVLHARGPRTALIDHGGFVSAVRFTEDGQLLSGSGDRMLRLWDVEHSVAVRTMAGHAGDVNALVLLGPGVCATASADGTLRVWDVRASEQPCVRLYVGHEGEALCVASPSASPRLASRIVATGGEDGTARVYDLAADREMQRITGVPGGLRQTPAGGAPSLTALSFSASGRLLFAAYESAAADAAVVGWDVLRPGESAVALVGHDQRVSSAALAPSGNVLATASWDETVRLWA